MIDPVDALRQRLEVEQKKLALVREVGLELSSSKEISTFLSVIVAKLTELMNAERCTLYLISDDGLELRSKVTSGDQTVEIRLRVGEGIAGWVAQTGEPLNLSDAYGDDRFQPAVDAKSGFTTRNMLCVPLLDRQSQVLGVVQVLNHKTGPFALSDMELLQGLASQAAIAIENAKLYLAAVKQNEELTKTAKALEQRTQELNVLYGIERQISSARSLEDLLSRILERAKVAVQADAGEIFLQENGELVGKAACGVLSPTRSMEQVQHCAEHGAAVITDRNLVESASNDKPAMTSQLCVPLVGERGVLGVLRLMGKDQEEEFSQADVQVATLIASQTSRAIDADTRKREKERQDQLANLGQMLAGLVHDLRTPMTIISGHAQLMVPEALQATREEYLSQILRQFELMNGMTKEVLAFARGETSVLLRKVYMQRFVIELRNQLTIAAKDLPVKIEFDSNYGDVAYFDELAMMRVIHNLFRNSVDAMGKIGGTFSLKVSKREHMLCLEAIDNGPGIPPEISRSLFVAFRTAKKGGTGLGLAICKKIVDEHGGQITCDSKAGQGTRFEILIPILSGKTRTGFDT